MHARISISDSLNLQLPETIKIRPNAQIHFRKNGWPFVRHNKTYQMPLISKNALKQRAATVQLNFTEHLITSSKISESNYSSAKPGQADNISQTAQADKISQTGQEDNLKTKYGKSYSFFTSVFIFCFSDRPMNHCMFNGN